MVQTTQKALGRRTYILVVISLLVAMPCMLAMIPQQAGELMASSASAKQEIPQFEVSTIKPSDSLDQGGRIDFTRTGFHASAVSLASLLKIAYRIEDNQILGLPPSAKHKVYDVEAKAGAGIDLESLSQDQRRQMIKSLLVERFDLKSHFEDRQLPSYILVVTKGGIRMKANPPGELGSSDQQALRMVGRGHLIARGVPMDGLIRALSDQLERPVVDKTNLLGYYDFSLVWTPDETTPDGGNLDRSASTTAVATGATAADDAPGPSLFAAVREQLGLALEKEKAPVSSLVIDSMHEPTAN